MRNSALIAFLLIFSFALGLLRDLFIANKLGISLQADIFFVALILPIFFENIAGIALRDGIIVDLKEINNDASSEAKIRAQILYSSAITISALLSLVLVLSSSALISIIMPGWSTEQKNAALVPFLIANTLIFIQTIYYFQTAILNLKGDFIAANWRPVFLNITILFILLLSSKPSPLELIIGMIFIQLIFIILLHHRISALASIRFQITFYKLRGIQLYGFIPLIIATIAQQLWIIIERWFASDMPSGTITLLTLSYRTVTIPQTLFSIAILAILYPIMARLWHKKQLESFAEILRRGQLILCLMIVPATVIFVIFPESVIQLLFERGEFDHIATEKSTPLFAAYAIGLPSLTLSLFWGRCLLSMGQNRYFYLVPILCLIVTIIISFILIDRYKVLGLALAPAIGNTLMAILYGIKIQKITTNGISIISIIRWIIASTLVVYFSNIFIFINIPIILKWAITGISVVFLVIILGDKNLLKRSFWKFS